MKFDGLVWDHGNLQKCRKHGVSLEEVEYVLMNDAAFAPDLVHSGSEQRFIGVGRNRAGRPLFVAFTLRWKGGLTLVRPISARYMHAKEASRYER